MQHHEKYAGIFPAFYACYEEDGTISPARARALARHLKDRGVQGLYVCGSSGECIYLNVEERKRFLEAVMEEIRQEMTVIAHVACNNTRDSMELARHAEALGVDAIAAIPPIYFHLPDSAIAEYWNSISAAAPNTDFIIYNIPQLAGVALSPNLLREMLKNPRVVGVKNSSMPVLDIEVFQTEGGRDFIVFNGPDEQLVAGLAAGAVGGIGGTYAAMPELYLAIYRHALRGEYDQAREIQYAANEITFKMCSCHGNMYAVIKEILSLRHGLSLGSVRAPLPGIVEADLPTVRMCAEMIDQAIARYCPQ